MHRQCVWEEPEQICSESFQVLPFLCVVTCCYCPCVTEGPGRDAQGLALVNHLLTNRRMG